MTEVSVLRFSGPTRTFHEQTLPEFATPAGYSALIDALELRVPLPGILFATGERHRILTTAEWHVLTSRHAPTATLEGHLTFALKYEGLNLAVLKRLFQKVGAGEIEALVRSKPTGAYARRLWFLYEWLLGDRLDLPDATQGTYVAAVDSTQQFAINGSLSRRHHVEDNLPGTPEFCPLVARTPAIEKFIGMDLSLRARNAVAAVPRDLLARTAAFLLLKDSKSSYAIEGEQPPQNRIQRWARAIGEAGKHPLSGEELLRLQAIVIGDARFVALGFRQQGGFIGEHDRESRLPLPVHVSARPDDLASLVTGMVSFAGGPALELDAVIAAAGLAFGFVYVHPFVDGNGRIHRYLIHHVLASRGFNPTGIVFPVSAAILDRLDAYITVLQDYSKRLLPLIEWEASQDGNVRVLNDTSDFYRFFDATPHAEFLFECVRKTIEEDLPREADYLARYDRFRSFVVDHIADMPERTLDLLFRFLRQNNGQLSRRAREREFSALSDGETAQLENAFAAEFRDQADDSPHILR
jgi:hypothetical protein